MSDANPGDSDVPSKPARSKLERALVWGLIAIGTLVVLVEGGAYLMFQRAYGGLQAELQKAETSDYQVTRAKVNEILGSRTPDETREVGGVGDSTEVYDVYHFNGLLKDRPLCVHYGVAGKTDEPEVIEVLSIIPDEILR